MNSYLGREPVVGVYVILHRETKRIYIGSSVHVRKRWAEHKSKLSRGKHENPRLQNAWNKYGADAFDFGVLETVLSIDLLTAREQFYLDFLAPFFNINVDAVRPPSAKGKTLSLEHRERISKSNRGKTVTENTRHRMSESAKNRKVSVATRAKLSEIRRREHLSEGTIQKLSEASKRQVWTEERRAKISDSNRSRGPRSEETRLKIRLSRLGMTASDDTRRKMSDSHRGIVRSEEYKSNMRDSLRTSESHREKMKSEETRAKMRKAAQGKILSDDHKRRIGAASREVWARKKEDLNATVEGHC